VKRVHMGAWRAPARESGSSLSLALNCSKIKSMQQERAGRYREGTIFTKIKLGKENEIKIRITGVSIFL